MKKLLKNSSTGAVLMIKVATPLKNSVSNGIGSLAFGAHGIYFEEFSDSKSTFKVLMTGKGVELIFGPVSAVLRSVDSFLSRCFDIENETETQFLLNLT